MHEAVSPSSVLLDPDLHTEVKRRVQSMQMLKVAAEAAIADLHAAMVRDLSAKLGIDLAAEAYSLDPERGVLTKAPTPGPAPTE